MQVCQMCSFSPFALGQILCQTSFVSHQCVYSVRIISCTLYTYTKIWHLIIHSNNKIVKETKNKTFTCSKANNARKMTCSDIFPRWLCMQMPDPYACGFSSHQCFWSWASLSVFFFYKEHLSKVMYESFLKMHPF